MGVGGSIAGLRPQYTHGKVLYCSLLRVKKKYKKKLQVPLQRYTINILKLPILLGSVHCTEYVLHIFHSKINKIKMTAITKSSNYSYVDIFSQALQYVHKLSLESVLD